MSIINQDLPVVQDKTISPDEGIQLFQAELETGIALPKCRKCGCMASALKNFDYALASIHTEHATLLAQNISGAFPKMRPIQYACLGCEHCYPAVAQNAFAFAFPAHASVAAELICKFHIQDESWPPVIGEYFIIDQAASVAVSTLASVQLAEKLVLLKPNGLSIVGKTETENIGIDKVIKNMITNPTLRYLLVAGAESKGHLTGQTLLALAENGVDDKGRVIGSAGKRPILRNVSASEIQTFREQVQVIDMIGCEDPDEISARIEELSQRVEEPCGCGECGGKPTVSISTTPTLTAVEPGEAVPMDKAGYFVIVPLVGKGVINIEHYAYDNSLLRVIEGTTAREIYFMIINNGWITELSHAAYLGKELTRAELSLQNGFRYVQDGA
ncbi:MAG TPA: DUF4346 domain-containing protein [Anaerolineales bacterium]|nr:DUF4346 domain-containing protein [Anaerolineales bacterium]